MSRPAPASLPIPTPNSSSKSASIRRRRCSARPRRPSASPARRDGGSKAIAVMTGTMSELRDGMQIGWDVPIEMDDGVTLRADVFRPVGDGKFPVILSYGPYAKGLSFQDGYKGNWARLTEAAPEVLEGS